MLLTGLRGVGKTVLLNEMERLAQQHGYHTISIEAHENKSLGASLDSEILTVGHKVKVIKGELSGIEGEVAIEANKTYVVIRIKDLLTASVKVPKSYLKIIG